jgi:hypothetical protein
MRLSVAAPYIVLFGLMSLVVALESVHAKAPKPTELPQAVEFDGQKLLLAWQGENPEQPIAEFIPEGETLDKWTHLASIRRYPDLEDAQGLAKMTVEEVEKTYPGSPTNLVDDPKSSDAIIEFVVESPDETFAEYNLFKYAKDPAGGVVAQQYALRTYGDRKTFLDELTAKRQKLLDEMADTGLAAASAKEAE